MIDPDDLAACRAAIRAGSKSFDAASRLLPARVRDPALALYAMCRTADDAVDGKGARHDAVRDLTERLHQIYAGRPTNRPEDRAFAAVVEQCEMPAALPLALLEGLDWDATGRRFASLSDLRAYGARVAGSVGAMMCVVMGVRDRDALARACDLGVAMQLTNIVRDIGEDARSGRVYLPTRWMADLGLGADQFIAAPHPDPRIAEIARRLLTEALRLYRRSEAGIAALPPDCRPAILASRHIYAAIGRNVFGTERNFLTHRARTSSGEKGALMALALAQAAVIAVMPRSAVLHAPPLPETAYLVDAAAVSGDREPEKSRNRSGTLISIMADLAAQDRNRRGSGMRPA